MAEPRGNRLQMLAGMLNVSLTWLITAEGDGLDVLPEGPKALSPRVEAALGELQQLRARATALAEELGQVEKRLRGTMRQEA